MHKFIDFLFKISKLIESIAYFLKDYKEKYPEYYVYVPDRNKPRYKHNSYKSAEIEAQRIAKSCTDNEAIEILRIEKRIWGDIPDVPF